MITITSSQQKGGVGKTTTIINVAYFLNLLSSQSNRTKKILLLDLDPQENLTDSVVTNKAESLVDASLLFNDDFDIQRTPPIQTDLDGVDLIRAGDSLSDVESMPLSVITNLKKNLQNLDYDYLLIDTPPSLGRLSLSALCTADFVYSPIKMDSYSLTGLEKFLNTVNSIKAQYNPSLEFIGMLPNLVDLKDAFQVKTLNEAKASWGDLIFKNCIKQSSSIPAAIREKRAIWDNPPNGNAAKVGRQVKEAVREVVARCVLSEKVGG